MPIFNKLLVLDLDGTLIFSNERKLSRDSDFNVGPYSVYKRPGVDIFLQRCLDRFEVGIWTSSTEDYAAEVVRHLFKDKASPAFVWSRLKCTKVYDPELREIYSIKNIRKLTKKGYRKEDIIIIDDSRKTFERNYGNAVLVREYEGQENDQELPKLLSFLETIGAVEDVRKIEKRDWRDANRTS